MCHSIPNQHTVLEPKQIWIMIWHKQNQDATAYKKLLFCEITYSTYWMCRLFFIMFLAEPAKDDSQLVNFSDSPYGLACSHTSNRCWPKEECKMARYPNFECLAKDHLARRLGKACHDEHWQFALSVHSKSTIWASLWCCLDAVSQRIGHVGKISFHKKTGPTFRISRVLGFPKPGICLR